MIRLQPLPGQTRLSFARSITDRFPHQIYRAFDAKARLLYVGCTTEPERRIAAHRRGNGRVGKLLERYAARFVVDPTLYRNKDAGRDAEIKAIYTEQPLFNIQDRCLPTHFVLAQIADYEDGIPVRGWPDEIQPSARVARAVAS